MSLEFRVPSSMLAVCDKRGVTHARDFARLTGRPTRNSEPETLTWSDLMDLFQLEIFVTVAREGSFSRAAEKLYRTQPAVSQAIRKLEREVGESLFDRSSRDGILTDAGQMLHEYAQKLLNLRSEAHTALKELREMHKGKLAIAANEFTCLYLLPALAEFRRLYPMVKVTVLR